MEGRKQYTEREAEQIRKLLREKNGASSETQKRLRSKLRRLGFYIRDFAEPGQQFGEEEFMNLVERGAIAIVADSKLTRSSAEVHSPISYKSMPTKSDEQYVINLCDTVLGERALRQHRFDFLRGDKGHTLPVDAYYPRLNLVVEYRERQHMEAVPIFDRRQTVSGVSRGEQRRIYDQRRRDVLSQHKIRLVELSYSDFLHKPNKRLLRQIAHDLDVVRRLLL